jgi:hypothetical protein
MNFFDNHSVQKLAQSAEAEVCRRDAFAPKGPHRSSFPAMETL